jgi:hypothetical protein
MDSNKILEKLSKMKKDLADMYDSLDVIRDNLSEQTKSGTNKARGLISKLDNVLDYQADLIIFEKRKDDIELQKILLKIKSIN